MTKETVKRSYSEILGLPLGGSNFQSVLTRLDLLASQLPGDYRSELYRVAAEFFEKGKFNGVFGILDLEERGEECSRLYKILASRIERREG